MTAKKKRKDLNELMAEGNLHQVLDRATRDPLMPEAYTERQLADMLGKFDPKEAAGFRTGIGRLDNHGGLKPEHCAILGADTSWGKSSMIVAMASEMKRHGAKVVIFSLEDKPRVYAQRFASRNYGIPANEWSSSKERPVEVVDRIEKYRKDADMYRPHVIDAIGIPAERVKHWVEIVVTNYDTDVVFVDYVGCLHVSGKSTENRRLEIHKVVGELQHTIKQAGASGVFASQLTMPKGGGMPTRECLRDCRDLAHQSELVLIGYYEDAQSGNREDRERWIFCDKNKTGEAAWKEQLAWDHHTASFQYTPEGGANRDDMAARRFSDDVSTDFDSF
jgi:replicative DNA helicase